MSNQEEDYRDANSDDKEKPSVLHSLESIEKSISKINTRLETLERHRSVEQAPLFTSRHNHVVTSTESTTDIQREYECIKDSLNKIKLPNELKLLDNKSGIKREDQPHLAAVAKSARYLL